VIFLHAKSEGWGFRTKGRKDTLKMRHGCYGWRKETAGFGNPAQSVFCPAFWKKTNEEFSATHEKILSRSFAGTVKQVLCLFVPRV
jgi:hypothetical protein